MLHKQRERERDGESLSLNNRVDISRVDLLSQDIQNPHCLEFGEKQQTTQTKKKKKMGEITRSGHGRGVERGLSELHRSTQSFVSRAVFVLFIALMPQIDLNAKSLILVRAALPLSILLRKIMNKKNKIFT